VHAPLSDQSDRRVGRKVARERTERKVSRVHWPFDVIQGASTVRIKVLHIGLGPIGAGIVRQVASRKNLVIVGAVDIDPEKCGKDLGEVCSTGRRLGVKVTADIVRTIKATKPDVAVLCTSSSLKKVLA
jgi:NADH/NAD ratio-sensing transcriptional regulator Rex